MILSSTLLVDTHYISPVTSSSGAQITNLVSTTQLAIERETGGRHLLKKTPSFMPLNIFRNNWASRIVQGLPRLSDIRSIARKCFIIATYPVGRGELIKARRLLFITRESYNCRSA